MKNTIRTLAATIILAPAIGSLEAHAATALAGMDDLDSYTSGSSIDGLGNGNIDWTITTPLPGSATAEVSNLQSVSSPNSFEVFTDNQSSGSIRAILDPTRAFLIDDVGDSLRINFYYRQTAPGNFFMRNFYADDAIGTGFTSKANSLTYGVSGFNFYADNGNNQTSGMAANTWYRWQLDITRAAGDAIEQTLSVFDLSDTLIGTAPGPAGQTFGTSNYIVGMSFNPGGGGSTTVFIDNVFASVIPEPSTVALFGIGALALRSTRRRPSCQFN